jgi:hypothetical protein
MAKNKMSQVAALFGKRLGEEFKVKRTIGDFYEVTVVITANGLFLRGKNAIVVNRMGVLEDLLTGKAVITDE